MRLLLLRSLSWGWALLAAAIILVALGVSVVRVVTPMANAYRAEVAAQVSRLLKRPVEIGSLRLAWEGLAPTLELREVRIKDDPGVSTVLRFDRLGVAIAPWRSLLARRLEPYRVTLAGSDVTITRTRDGRLLMRGLQHLQQEQDGSGVNPLELLSGLQVRLADIGVRWRDLPLGRDFSFKAREVDVQVQPDSVAFDGRVDLPPRLGRALRVVFRARGPLQDFTTWASEFYVMGNGLELAGWPLQWLPGVPGIRGGRLDLRLWGQRDASKRIQAMGDVALADFSLGKADVATPGFIVPQITSRVGFTGTRDDWRVDLDQLWVVTQAAAWPASGLSVSYAREGDGLRLGLAADWLDLGSAAEVALLFDRLPASSRGWLADLRPGGGLSELRAAVHLDGNGQPLRYAVAGALEGLHWRGARGVPAVSGLRSRFQATEGGGSATLSGQALELDYPAWFSGPLRVDELAAEVDWEVGAEGWRARADRLLIANRDLRLSGGAAVAKAAGADWPELQLEVQVPRLDVARGRAYIPYGALHPHTAEWLQSALVGGEIRDGRVTWHGPLSGAAFHAGKAELRAGFEVRDATLRYQNGWPELNALEGSVRFDNARLAAEVRGARVFDSTLRSGRALIADLHDSLLEVQARAAGPLADVLRFLRESPLSHGVEALLAASEVRGASELDLRLGLHLHHHEGVRDQVEGELRLLGNGLRLAQGRVAVDSARGRLRFTERSYAAEGIQATFRGRPVTIGVVTEGDGTVRVSTTGTFKPAELLPDHAKVLSPLVSGESEWTGVVTVPHHHAGPVTLALHSDLRGTELRLPKPLGKPSINARDLRLTLTLDREPTEFELRYAGLVHGKGLAHFEPTFAPERMSIGLGQPPSALPPRGLHAAGRWPELDLAEWVSWLSGASQDGGANPRKSALPVVVDGLHLGELRIGDQRFPQATLTLAHDSEAWQVAVESKDLRGSLTLPADWQQGASLKADLKYLRLSRPKAPSEVDDSALGDTRASWSPQALPALDVRIGELYWGDTHFEQSLVRTRRTEEGQRIDAVRLQSANLAAEMAGHWHAVGDGRQETFLDLAVNGSDAGAILRDLFGSTGFGSGSGQLTGWLRWPGAPYNLQPAALDGQLQTTLRNGRLLEFDPGLGRLVGLLSVDYLPKRLTLNFRDVASEGFYYDVLRGAVRFEAGSGYIDDLTIKGAAADLRLSGRMGLVSEDFDLRLHVAPKLFSTLPVAAGVFVNPAAGLMVYLADKLAENVGIDINEGSGSDYTITGSWSNPRITPSSAREGG